MSFGSWRGTVGVIKPTRRPGSLEDFVRLLPEGIGVVPEFLDTRHGKRAEFERALELVDLKVGELAEAGADLVHPEGSPMSTILGFDKEVEFVEELRQQHGVPVMTSVMAQIEAMRALEMQRIISFTRKGSELNAAKKEYLADAGFDVVAMEEIEVSFEDLGQFSDREFYVRAKNSFLRFGNIDGIHVFGSGWRLLGILEVLEQDLGVPVIYPVAARVWAVQRRLCVRETRNGYGRLLEEMPPLAG